jgi:hypothetical protein
VKLESVSNLQRCGTGWKLKRQQVSIKAWMDDEGCVVTILVEGKGCSWDDATPQKLCQIAVA